MPELPEVHTVVTELNTKLAGRTIKRVAIATAKVISVGPQTVSNVRSVDQATVDAFAKHLKGQTITGVRRRAKMLLFDLSGPWHVLVHLKMTGQFLFEDEAQKAKTGSKYRILNKADAPLVKLPGKHTHVVFYFTDGSTLYFNDMRQFGYLKLVAEKDLPHVKELHSYGPEPLDKTFTYEIFEKALKSRGRTSVKQALLDPKLVVGIGNIYSDEILFMAKVRPERKVASLKPAERRAVFNAIVPVLKLGIKHKGSSVGEFIRTDGSFGTTGKHHFVYGRKKQPCKVCGTLIMNIKLGGRTACYCPHCQK